MAILLLLSLPGCATPETQLRTGLAAAGLPDATARCMARDMMPHLSVAQLLRLRSLSHAADHDPRKAGMEATLHRIRALGDGAIWATASHAAARCALGW